MKAMLPGERTQNISALGTTHHGERCVFLSVAGAEIFLIVTRAAAAFLARSSYRLGPGKTANSELLLLRTNEGNKLLLHIERRY